MASARSVASSASTSSNTDRRRHARAAVVARASLYSAEDHLGAFPLENLCAGGALVVGAPPAPPGARLIVVLVLAERPPMRLIGEVVRVERRGDACALALSFRAVPVAMEDLIQDAVLEELAAEKADGGDTGVDFATD